LKELEKAEAAAWAAKNLPVSFNKNIDKNFSRTISYSRKGPASGTVNHFVLTLFYQDHPVQTSHISIQISRGSLKQIGSL
jgi:hypothetical protein